MMGLEEHLLGDVPRRLRIPRRRCALASRRHGVDAPQARAAEAPPRRRPPRSCGPTSTLAWADDAESELKKIPFFVRGKARRNTERFADERGLATITLETLYDAKAHFAR